MHHIDYDRMAVLDVSALGLARYLMIVKGNQPSLMAAVAEALAGPDKAQATVAASGAASAPPRPAASAGRTPPAHPPGQRPCPRPVDA